jgi:4a-hydroxytetrahydrobiopterin dehydratase
MSAAAVSAALQGLAGWEHSEGALHKTYTFSDFREAMSFVVRVAFEAEALNHHPEWTNVYNAVRIKLTTHDAGNRVTALDIALATAVERFSWVG